jgi:hypothetical protein
MCVFQDLKFRGIHIAVFPVILLIALYFNFWMNWGWLDLIKSLSFLTVTLVVLFLYLSAKNKGFVPLFKQYLGLGDVLFFIAVLPLFSFRNFILFFITGMLASMLFHVLLSSFQTKKTIPLAGYLSIYLIGLITYAFVNTNPSFFKMDIL